MKSRYLNLSTLICAIDFLRGNLVNCETVNGNLYLVVVTIDLTVTTTTTFCPESYSPSGGIKIGSTTADVGITSSASTFYSTHTTTSASSVPNYPAYSSSCDSTTTTSTTTCSSTTSTTSTPSTTCSSSTSTSTTWSTSSTSSTSYTSSTFSTPPSSTSPSTLFTAHSSMPTATGSIITSLPTMSNPVTIATKKTSTLSSSLTTSTLSSAITVTSSTTSSSGCTFVDIFQPIATDEPSSYFPRASSGFSIPRSVNTGNPLQTNKFYKNLFLGSQTSPVYTYPYSVWWSYDITGLEGLGVSHTTFDSLVYGDNQPENQGGAPSYYINPVKILSIGFSASQFADHSFDLSINELTQFSVLASLYDNTTSFNDRIDFHLVQGMGMVTAIYSGDLIPKIISQVGVMSLVEDSSSSIGERTIKYKAQLFNNIYWLVYITVPASYDINKFDVALDSTYITVTEAIDGLVVQVAVAPEDVNDEYYFDITAGTYTTDASLSGFTSDCGVSATYSITYSTQGSSVGNKPIVFALPHHEQSITQSTSESATGIYLFTPTKGYGQAYVTSVLEFNLQLEAANVDFLPYTTIQHEDKDIAYTKDQICLMADVANYEMSQDIATTIKTLSTYFAGKYIAKYSYILLVADEIIKDEDFTQMVLQQLIEAFDAVIANQLVFEFEYDPIVKGITSDSTPADNYGFSFFNDHHFHFGYFLVAAAIVGSVDSKYGGTWAQDNKEYFNTLVRDASNPSVADNYFPTSRMFDWYHGHSWASGLFEAGDGNNQESTSEDFNFAYGMKMWGKAIGDFDMEVRGNLMISVLKASLNSYYYYTDDNTIEPSVFIPNKVGGIVFENKIDHTTFFGVNPEYIHGIHMIPTTAVSSILRGPKFVQQEWESTIVPIIDGVHSGWTGILKLNQALFDSNSSYSFFSQDAFDYSLLDDGQSRTWSLAYSAGIMNLVN